MITNSLNIGLIVVVRDMGQVRHAVAAPKNIVKTAVVVQICSVQGEPARLVGPHGFEKAALGIVSWVAYTGAHAVPPVEQAPDYPATNEARSAGDGDRAIFRNR